MQITFTVDLEDPTERYLTIGRCGRQMQRVIDFSKNLPCRGTFFTVGRLARTYPKLIRRLAADGHEIAYHTHAHVPLTGEHPARFQREMREDKDVLEQLAGKTVIGFRAPRFSLTPQSRWAVDAIAEAGFRYSSSVMPTTVSLYGYPNAPCVPFRWPNGLIELPLPIGRFIGMRLPYLGGVYLYALPFRLVRKLAHSADGSEVLWTYTHPYDLDRWEMFKPMPDTKLWVSVALWLSRQVARGKLRKTLALGMAPPLGERIMSMENLPVFQG